MPESMDAAERLRVVGHMDDETTLAVYWRAFETTFRARLTPIQGGEALTIPSIVEVEFDGFEIPGTETDRQTCRYIHVPPVVREAVQRPVQYPDNEDNEDEDP
jgi:hypothetical protein